ncbi:hypothetical protein K474DRAFT_548472 [Panus rudis PR-1116 ss-1]|nr:hypothetical protein K474DRAFT_548472 [Panus rudis PR-1116 ss-1]
MPVRYIVWSSAPRGATTRVRLRLASGVIRRKKVDSDGLAVACPIVRHFTQASAQLTEVIQNRICTIRDIVLRFVYYSDERYDKRSVRIYEIKEDGQQVQIYNFFHPLADTTLGTTTEYYRRLASTGNEHRAGHIEWTTRFQPYVYWGGLQPKVGTKELRKIKNKSSKSRRFKVDGTEYKWKIKADGQGLVCERGRGRVVAEWNEPTKTLRVSSDEVPREEVLDRFVVTCYLNLWFWYGDRW